jgi:hypothetical protein
VVGAHRASILHPVRAGNGRVPQVMEVNPSFPANTVPEFIAYAKADPGKINFGSAGTGTSIHVAGELFKMMAGVDMVHVPYRGGATALTDLLGGQIHFRHLAQLDRVHQGRQVACAGSDHGDAEQRKTLRRFTRCAATLSFDAQRPSVDCVIWDLSQGGARLAIALPLTELPHQFTLHVFRCHACLSRATLIVGNGQQEGHSIG